jgi:hypothetical protein
MAAGAAQVMVGVVLVIGGVVLPPLPPPQPATARAAKEIKPNEYNVFNPLTCAAPGRLDWALAPLYFTAEQE